TNMETLDSDAIYRDFKELIVELNFFDKEELTNIPTKTFEWPIPEAGSAGWPVRKFEKKENDWGTLIHSKLDLDYLQGIEDLKIKKAFSLFEGINLSDPGVDNGANVSAIDFESASNNKPNGLVGNMSDMFSATRTTDTTLVGANNCSVKEESGMGYDHKVIVDGVEYTQHYQAGVSEYSDKTFTWSGSTKTIGGAACGPCSCVNLATGYGVDCNPLKDIVGLNFDATIPGCAVFFEKLTGVTSKTDFSESEYVSAMHQAFSEGKPCIVLVEASKGPDTFWTSGGHFVGCVGEDSSGTLYTVDSGSRADERRVYPKGVEGIAQYMVGLMIPDEAPKGRKETPNPYEGYEAGQLVVSPVTGVVIDAGMTNPGNSKDKLNLDTELKESVGFVKIRVLDEKDYKAIFGDADPDSLDDDLKGYAYFLEEYKRANVEGSIMYIEGFNLELLSDKDTLGSNLDNILDKNGKTSEGQDKPIINMYTERNYDDVLSKDAREKLEEKEEARTGAKPYYKTSAGILIKEGTALGTCYDDGDGAREKFKQLYEEQKEKYKLKEDTGEGKDPFKEKESSDSEEEPWKDRNITQRPGMVPNDSEKVTDEIMKEKGNGNNIRIVMRTSQDGSDKTNEKDSVIEDVEDYIETEQIEEKVNNMEMFMAWQALEPEGFHYNIPEIGNTIEQDGHPCRRDNPSDKFGHDYAVCNGGVGDDNLCPGMYLGEGQLARTLVLERAGSISKYSTWVKGEDQLDIYTQVLENEGEIVKQQLGGIELNDDQLYALIDVMYAGIGYFNKGGFADKIKAGQTPTKEDFVNTIKDTPYWALNANGSKRRRLADYYIYTEGIYPCAIYDEQGDEFSRQYDWKDDTPFQDLMKDINPADKVPFTGKK
nr:C39 family peptidase [Clostridia bacterium]